MKLSRTTALIISIMCGMFGALCAGLGTAIEAYVLAFIGVGLALIGAVLSLIFNRCPSCGRFLGKHAGFSVEYCPYCGEKLDE